MFVQCDDVSNAELALHTNNFDLSENQCLADAAVHHAHYIIKTERTDVTPCFRRRLPWVVENLSVGCHVWICQITAGMRGVVRLAVCRQCIGLWGVMSRRDISVVLSLPVLKTCRARLST